MRETLIGGLLGCALLANSLACLAGCQSNSGPPSIQTDSSSIAPLQDRVQTLEKYVTFRRQYLSLEFVLFYKNNGGGLVPGPSEWDIRLIAQVPPAQLSQWRPSQIQPVRPSDQKSPVWVTQIPGSIPKDGLTEWYRQNGLEVGIDPKAAIVAYRNFSQ